TSLRVTGTRRAKDSAALPRTRAAAAFRASGIPESPRSPRAPGGRGAWCPDGPALPPAPARVPGAACECRGSVCFADSGARGEGPGGGLWSPPSVPPPLQFSSPFARCPRRSLPFSASFNVNSSARLHPSRPLPPPGEPVPPFRPSSRSLLGFQLAFCCFIFPPPLLFPPPPTRETCFGQGSPSSHSCPPVSLGTAACAGPSIVPRSKSAPPSPWRDSEARARPAFSPGDSAR
ncbi:unnamed protein product, partial [Rangifer tarandus platyrhynchus]